MMLLTYLFGTQMTQLKKQQQQLQRDKTLEGICLALSSWKVSSLKEVTNSSCI